MLKGNYKIDVSNCIGGKKGKAPGRAFCSMGHSWHESGRKVADLDF